MDYSERVPKDFWKENNMYLKHIARLERNSGLRKVGKRYMRWLDTLDDRTRNELLVAASKRGTCKRLYSTLNIFKGVFERK